MKKSEQVVNIKTEEKGRQALFKLVKLTGMIQYKLTTDLFEKALFEYEKKGERKYVKMKFEQDEPGKQYTVRTERRGRDALQKLSRLTKIMQYDLSEQIFLLELENFTKKPEDHEKKASRLIKVAGGDWSEDEKKLFIKVLKENHDCGYGIDFDILKIYPEGVKWLIFYVAKKSSLSYDCLSIMKKEVL